MKKLTILLISAFIAFMPLFNINFNNVYAEENESAWTYITDQVSEANKTATIAILKAYLGARNFTMFYTYPVEKAIVSWNYAKWNEIAKLAGFSGLDEFNDRIAYAYDKNQKLKFYLDATGVSKANLLYQTILEYYGIGENQSKSLYSGKWFQDDDDNGCYVFISTSSFNETKLATYNQYVSATGTYYRFNYTECQAIYNSLSNGSYNEYNITVNNQLLKTWYLYKHIEGNDYTGLCLNFSNNKTDFSRTKCIKWNYVNTNNKLFSTIDGFPCIIQSNNNLYIGNYRSVYYDENDTRYTLTFSSYGQLNTNSAVNAAISAAQGGMNAGIVAQGKAAAISTGKEGLDAIKDYLEDNDATDDDEVTPVDDPVNPPDVNPPGINIPVGIVNNMPINIQLPDLDDLIPDPIQQIPQGFTIPGLRYKFPFCIPFDMVAIYEVLDQTPQAPYFETEINFASFNYDLVIDLEEYDPYMVHIRNYFLILYIFGLLFITPKLLKA